VAMTSGLLGVSLIGLYVYTTTSLVKSTKSWNSKYPSPLYTLIDYAVEPMGLKVRWI
jgi:hypothetical protein